MKTHCLPFQNVNETSATIRLEAVELERLGEGAPIFCFGYNLLKGNVPFVNSK